jgi:hypothetical protein
MWVRCARSEPRESSCVQEDCARSSVRVGAQTVRIAVSSRCRERTVWIRYVPGGQPRDMRRGLIKKAVVVSIALAVALLHFVTGPDYGGPFPLFVNGYLIDVLLPFAFYFLLGLNEVSLLRSWVVKTLLVFGAGSSVEIAQFYGLPVLGRTYDPVDFLMYGIGVALAAVLDTVVFPRAFDSWTPQAGESS